MMSERPWHDPPHRLNGEKYRTTKKCIEAGCENKAGTAWSHLWCQPCNAKRMDRIDAGFASLRKREGSDG